VSPEDKLADEALAAKSALCCPTCDVEGRSQLEALAIGVALGVAYRDIHRITESMCAAHRSQWFLAMVKAGRAVDSVPEGEAKKTEAERACDHFLSGAPMRDFEG
jgi:hypothetical protein